MSSTQQQQQQLRSTVIIAWKMQSDRIRRNSNRQRQEEQFKSLVPFGPVPRGGGGTVAVGPLVNTWRNVRVGVSGARRRVAHTVNVGVLKGAMTRQLQQQLQGGVSENAAVGITAADLGSANNSRRAMNRSMLKVGFHRRLLRRRENAMESTASATTADDAVLTTKVNASTVLSITRGLFQRKHIGQQDGMMIGTAHEHTASALSSRGGSSTTAVLSSSTGNVSGIGNAMDKDAYYIIETPLFPIILPKSFEPRSSTTASSSTSTTATSAVSSSLEISVAEPTSQTSTTAKPSPQLLQAATQPLLPKQTLESFTGREFYYPESYEALAVTGMKMTLGSESNEHVKWAGEKKTDKFLKEAAAANTKEWYTALDSSQEVLVWAGKFTASASGNDAGYGSDLPIIKTTSIIHQSPRYLAELLMDSNKVQVYNKMSLGRSDVKVFQTGVDTQGGSFGDGESKVVRNLTKPPMVSSLIEFVTCMHARKLRPSDMDILSYGSTGNDGDTSMAPESKNGNELGYIVVSRAVTGGEWDNNSSNAKSDNGEKLVRNEILLGVNILKAVPDEPDKTELTSVTHVYSPMIPLMLAKNAGVKGAVDFVRDIRALP